MLSTGALEHARIALGDANVVVVCGAGPKELFRAVPSLERLITIDKSQGRWSGLWRALRRERFDLSIDLRGSLVTYGLSSRRRIVHRKSAVLRHKVEEIAALLKASTPPAPVLHVDARAEADALTALGPASPSLVLGAGAHFVGKRWPADRFAELAQRLLAGPLQGRSVLLLGGPGETDSAAAIEAALAGADVRNACGKLDLLAVAAAMRRAVLFVGNDSGLMHIAAAAGAPTLGLFGPSDERVYGPWGARNRTVRGPRSYRDLVNSGHMPHIEHSLMEDLPVEAVERVALEMLGGGGLA